MRNDWRRDPEVLKRLVEPGESKQLVKVEAAIKQLLFITGVQTAPQTYRINLGLFKGHSRQLLNLCAHCKRGMCTDTDTGILACGDWLFLNERGRGK